MLNAVFFLVGLLLGRFWFGAIALSLVYGVPRAFFHSLRRELRISSVFFYLLWAVAWAVPFVAAAFGLVVFFPEAARYLRDSSAFTYGQFVGVWFGILQMASRGGRADLDEDFWDAMASYKR